LYQSVSADLLGAGNRPASYRCISNAVYRLCSLSC